MSEEKEKSLISIGFFELLAIALIVLKLTGYFPYSWWWILAIFLAPVLLWVIGFVGAFVVYVGGVIVLMITELIDWIRNEF